MVRNACGMLLPLSVGVVTHSDVAVIVILLLLVIIITAVCLFARVTPLIGEDFFVALGEFILLHLLCS